MSVFVLYASYTLACCFPGRSTANADAALRRLEPREDNAVVLWVWQVEVGNALGKAVTRANVPLSRALDIWAGLLLLPIRQVDIGGIPPLITLAVKHDLPVYDTCYPQAAVAARLPLATNDNKLKEAAEANHLVTLTP